MSRKCKSPEALNLLPLRLMLPERLTKLMEKYRLRYGGLALVLQCPEQTVRNWADGKVTPPSLLLPLMDLLEVNDTVRQELGVYRYRCKLQAPRGLKVRPEKAREKSRWLAARNLPAKDSERYFDVDLFLEGPVNVPAAAGKGLPAIDEE